MSPITTHILDTALGRPAQGVAVTLAQLTSENSWDSIGSGTTNADGRITDLLPADTTITAGVYRLTFEVGAYFAASKQTAFYPFIPIIFEIKASDEHYHVPLLLNPFGYSTYRGS